MDAKIESQRQEMKAEMERQRKEIEQLRKPQMARDAVSEDQLQALQLRLESLLEAQLLTDVEVESLEDTVVDCIEVLPTGFASDRGVDKVVKMILVSEKLANDKTLARQLRRKFV